MKRFIILITSLLFVSSLFAYTERKVISNVGIPRHVSYIQFNNGGNVMVEGTDVDVCIEVHTDESKLSFTNNGNMIQFYVYVVTIKKGKLYKGDGLYVPIENKTVKIVDSESLSITFIE